MSQQRCTRKIYTEADVQLAIQDLSSHQIKSKRRAAATYNVPRRTLVDRRNGTRPRRDCEPNSKRMTKLEEKAIEEGILEYSARGLPVTRAEVRDMADRLLRERNGRPVGKNWVDNFIKRTPELRTRWSRPYDRQRAACEDPRYYR
jgi:hypothetical protein